MCECRIDGGGVIIQAWFVARLLQHLVLLAWFMPKLLEWNLWILEWNLWTALSAKEEAWKSVIWESGVGGLLCTNRLNGNNRLIDASEKNKWLSDIKEPELWEIL